MFMQLFTPGIYKYSIQCNFLIILLTIISLNTNAQRGYNLVYSENLKGGTAIFGNTLLHIVRLSDNLVDTLKMNSNRATGNTDYGNDLENMLNIDVDGNTGAGVVTRNSSSADLILPKGSTIKFARLYWGGRINTKEYDLKETSNQTVKLRKDDGAYTDVKALIIDTIEIARNVHQYQAYADVTSFIAQNKGGTYTIGNVPLTTGSVGNGGNHGGWTIVVVFENMAEAYNSVRVYDGFRKIYGSGLNITSNIILTGLNVPSGTLVAKDAKMSVLAWEGDGNLGGDFLKINNTSFSNLTNPFDNPWNGTITNNGIHVTTKNPNYTNNMGIDIDMFDVGTGYNIKPNDQTVSLEFGTKADQYFPGLFTFSIKMKDPSVSLITLVSDANSNGQAEAGELLTYTLKGKNVGIGNANLIELIDTLPSTVTYVPNTLKVIQSPGITPGLKTDLTGDDVADYISNGSIKTIKLRIGNGASALSGGFLAEGETYEVQFQVTVNEPAKGQPVPSILNIARVNAQSDAAVKFHNDATATLSREAAILPVSLVKFTASIINGHRSVINWSTSQEINNRYYIVEKSNNGQTFTTVAKVSGNGTTSLKHTYSITDDISTADNVIYYRLKQVDFDDKFNYSHIITLKINDENKVLNISPNPFVSYINVKMDWLKNEIISVNILDVEGKILVNKKLQASKGANNLRMNELSNLSSGSYFIQFISATERQTHKILK